MPKHISLLLMSLLAIGLNAMAQLNPPLGASPWKYVNPSPIGFTMTDMSFIDNSTGLAVGSSGAIARTTDSGRNWIFIPYKFVNSSNTVTLASFNDVQFVTPSIAYAVGTGGLMVKSTDGGFNWTPLVNPLSGLGKNINGLHFLNKDTGYIGGAAINTTNTTNINDAPKVYFTRNGGLSWDSLASPFRPQQNNVTLSGFNQSEIHRIVFLNDSIGYISGSCGTSIPNYSSILWKFEKGVLKDYSIHRTKFGVSITTGTGSNPAQGTQTYKGLVAVNDSLVIISSNSNGIAVRVRTGKNDSTANAVPAIYGAYEKGKYELILQLNTNPSIPAGSTLSPGQMWHIKKSPNGNLIMSDGNRIAFSSDNGTNWNSTQVVPATSKIAHWSFSALDVTPNGRIVAAGVNGMTYDSLPGSPWRTVYKNIRPLFYSYSDMDWADCNNGVAVGSTGTISKTSDGGKTWVDNSNNVLDAAQIGLVNVVYRAIDTMYFSTAAFGTNGVFRSADQGTTNDVLFTEPSPNSGGLMNFTMPTASRAFVIAHRFNPDVQRTMIFRSLNINTASPVWDTVKTFPIGNLAPQLRSIKFANQDTGYTCGSRGKVYRTVNGGNTWTDVSPDTLVAGNGTATYNALSVINGKTLYVAGTGKKLFRSNDAGVTWIDLTLVQPVSPITITQFTSLTAMVMNDVNNGYIIAGGYLLITNNGWSTWTYDMSPQTGPALSLYPKKAGPIQSKKLFIFPLIAGFGGPGSTQSAAIIEYSNLSTVNVSSSETLTNANCTDPTAGSLTVSPTGGIAPYTFSLDGITFQSSNTFTGLTQGEKTITIRDAGCQVITKKVIVGFTDNLTLTTNNDTTVCAGAPVQLIATSPANSYTWTPAGGLTASNISNPVATVNNSTAFTVSASLNGCVRTKTVNITIKDNPVVSAGPDKTMVNGDVIRLDGSGTSTPASIAWTPANSLTGAATYTPQAKPVSTTTYTLVVKDNNGCTSTDDVLVTVIQYCIKAMNAFTPNGDGMNDKWLVTNGGDCTKEIAVKVYNRYGSLVYSNDNYENNWDGNYKGKPIPDATYYYTINYKLINGTTVRAKGDVTILR